MSIWSALGFMFLGGAIVGLFNAQAWSMYNRGKREAQEGRMLDERTKYGNRTSGR